jgi:UDP-N-acetylmuramyl pentapeptide phosphotransferase/UDP-N-acetylglucosamine-1-phosphate transferase
MTSYIFLHLRSFIACMVSVSSLWAIGAFFLFNVFGKESRHTKIFMGDTGSMTLGLILSYLTVSLSFMNYGPLYAENRIIVIPVLSSLLVPVLDVVRLFFQRIFHHRSPFLPDANHIHHRLLHLGLDPRSAAIILLALSVVMTGVSVLLVKIVDVNVILLVEALLFAGFHGLITLLSPKEG